MTDEGADAGFASELLGGVPEAFVHTALLAGGVGLWEWPIGSERMALSPYLETLLGYPPGGFESTKSSILQTHGVSGGNVHFEITESAMLADPARAIETITDLNTLGICFSMDDFGIGFSSLSSLKRLPLASLKIDRSFIAQIRRVSATPRSCVQRLTLRMTSVSRLLPRAWSRLIRSL